MSTPTAVTDRMQRQIQLWGAVGDRRAVFLSCYDLMTRNMLAALDSGEFGDRDWVFALLRRFADYYFDALDVYERGPDAAPAVWRVAHEVAGRAHSRPLQNLLLGVNAHINYDLVLTLVDMLEGEWPQLPAAGRAGRYADHSYVNEIIGRTIDAVQDSIIERETPAMDIVDKLLGPADEWLISRLIARWRDEVWQEAVRLLETRDLQARKTLRDQVEAATLRRAAAILLEGSPIALFHLP